MRREISPGSAVPRSDGTMLNFATDLAMTWHTQYRVSESFYYMCKYSKFVRYVVYGNSLWHIVMFTKFWGFSNVS